MADATKGVRAKEAQRLRREKQSSYKKYHKLDVIEMLQGVVGLSKADLSDVFDAFCEVLRDLASEECVVFLPKFGSFIFEPKHIRKQWNSKEAKTLYYQGSKVSFRIARSLKQLLRKNFRKNCYALADLNQMKPEDFKPPRKATWLNREKS